VLISALQVEETGQKHTVLTLYELTEGEATSSQGRDFLHVDELCCHSQQVEFHGMDPELLQKALNILVKRGKAQVFGQEDQQGVKFF
jgi:ESCRT-II complex subunit VPS25